MSDLSLRLSANTAELKSGLNEAKGALNEFSKDAKSAVMKTVDSFKGLDATTGSVKELRTAFRTLNNISFAGKSVEEIAAINAEIGRLKDEMGDLKSKQKNLGTEFGELAAKGLQGIAGLAEVGLALGSVMGMSEKNAAKMQAQMTMMIGAVQGLGQFQAMMGDKVLQTIALRVKDTIATAAQTAAQWALNTSLLVVVGTIGAVIAVGAALAAGIYFLISGFRNEESRVKQLSLEYDNLISKKNNLVTQGEHQLRKMEAAGASEIEISKKKIENWKAEIAAIEASNRKFENLSTKEQETKREAYNKDIDRRNAIDDAIEEEEIRIETLGKTSKKVSSGMVKDAKEVLDAWYIPIDTGYSEKLRIMAEMSKETHDEEKKLADAQEKEDQERLDREDAALSASFTNRYQAAAAAILKPKTALQALNKDLRESGAYGTIATNAIAGLGDAIISMAEGSTDSFKNLVTSMLNGIRQIINGLLAQAIAAMIAKEAHKGLLGLILASVGVAALTALWVAKVPKFATGGIVGGSSYTGDKVPVMANSGEMILNGTQQAKLFSMIAFGNSSNNSNRGGQVEFEIKGDKLVGVLNNYGKKINSTR